MMRVIVEIHPNGNMSMKREIACIDIANVSELAEVSDYVIHAALEHGESIRVHVRGHHRGDGWMPLVRRAISALEGMPR